MTTPETPYLSLDLIFPSATNPRKTFDQAQLDELAASIRTHGVLQPILVRPRPRAVEDQVQYFEIVAGERRFRAAKLASQTLIPAVVREMEDDDVIEVQIIENLQRADVHPLEEAEGYERLMRGRGNVLGVDTVAERIGKSRGYVYARLKLLALLPQAREAFRAGKLTPSTALYLARVPADRQLEALQDLTEDHRSGDGPISAREASWILQRGYMLELARAPFDVKSITLAAAAGSCDACPKRTSAQPEMFADVSSEDRCTDPTCWDSKVRAHGQQIVAKAEADGLQVVDGAAAKKVWANNWGAPAGYVRADEKCYEVGGGNKTWAKAVAGKVSPVAIVNPRSGAADLFIPEKEARAAIRGTKATGPSEDTIREKKRQAEMAVRRELLTRILATEEPITLDDQRSIARALAKRMLTDAMRPLRKVAGWIPEEHAQLLAKIDAADVDELRRLLLAMSLAGELVIWPHATPKPSAELEAAAARRGVDVKAVRAELAAAEKAKAKPKAASKKPAPAAKAPKKAKKADSGKKPTAAYRDSFGNTWSGRGKQPKWVANELAKGRTLDDLRVQATAATGWPFPTEKAERAAA